MESKFSYTYNDIVNIHNVQVSDYVLDTKIKIVNVITTADLKQKFDITKLNNYSWGIYDQVSYSGICGYVKSPEMKGRVTIFATGKMISVGSDSIEDSVKKLNQTKFYLLKENLIEDIKLEPLVRNIVSTITCERKLDLKKLVGTIPNAVYEPEKFAGLRYKIRDGLTALIFGSGKIIIVGAKSFEEINYAFDKITKFVKI